MQRLCYTANQETVCIVEKQLGRMAQYPHFGYSMSSLRKVGDRLSKTIHHDEWRKPVEQERITELFAVANNWRDSHIMPMRSVRYSVRYAIRKLNIEGDLASRPKRMPSIRRKLKDSSVKLDQMNDLGGCRAIMDDIAGVRALVHQIEQTFPHDIRKEYRYIDDPKKDGYRSHHIVFNFVPKSQEQKPFEGRRIELQIRTRLQHSWATAIEAVSLFTGTDLKHHRGHENWLRLFELTSAEFAFAESCPTADGVPGHHERVSEIRQLCRELKAINTLENIKNATHYAENFVSDNAKYYLIKYQSDHTVSVQPYSGAILAAAALQNEEQKNEFGFADSKVVLVEVDQVERLVQTYPNYFGDVSLFVRNLRNLCEGSRAVEYSMTPQKVIKQKPRERPDPAALRRRYSKWTEN
ncbi:MAG: RelA/SpoT domain-containing protein [Hyphomicrobiales bacterium]